jgi:hypothetical protein
MKHNFFLRPLKKKGFKEERVTTFGWYDIGKSHDSGLQQEPCWFNPGGLVPHRQVLASMRRFAEEVMPAVRGL